MRKILFLFTIILLQSTYIYPQWSNDPTLNTPVCITQGEQVNPLTISDGNNGAIVCWLDASTSQIYVQRIDSSGYIMWNPIGVRLSPLSDYNFYHQITTDQQGGAIITWEAFNNGDDNIYAQRIDSFGNLLWDTLGVGICMKPLPQTEPIIISDGAGGAIILWQDRESGAGVCGLYAQRINSEGQALWAINGIPICTSPFQDPIQFHPVIVSDGEAGTIVAWDDTRNANTRVYAQRVNGDGSLQWPGNGVQISQLPGEDGIQAITSVGDNEFVIAWTNGISTFTETNIYVQKINGTGTLMWGSSGIPISTSVGNQYKCVIANDNNSGAILSWEDRRNVEADIYSQRIDSSGVIKWQEDGIPVCSKINYQMTPRIIPDGNNGAIICWLDHDGNNFDVWGQRIDEFGLPKWQSNGVPISITLKYDIYIGMISDGLGGAILAWDDQRNGDNNDDIFAQRIDENGNLVLTDVNDKLNQNFPVEYRLSQNYPNPFNPNTKISWQSPAGGVQTLKIYDVLGNEVATLVNEYKPAGSYEITWSADQLPSGVYFYQLKAENYIETKKMILLK